MNTVVIPSPLGSVRISEDTAGICEISFVPGERPSGKPEGKYIPEAARQLGEYFDGKRKVFSVPLSIGGTEFQRKVSRALLEIPYGETRSYSDVARSVGSPQACRAVGGAANKNKLCIIVPCHRVIGKNGAPVGFAAGVDIKLALLGLEKKNYAAARI